MKQLLTVLGIIFLIIFSSCRKDFDTVPSFGELKFSKDTVYLDTVFTNIGSATYNLKIYNNSNQNISIPKIQLAKGNASKYRLNVDGIAGKEFENIDILAHDSIYVFVETTVDITTLSNPLYTDKILFDNGNRQQKVDLVTLVKDAHFIYPGRNPVNFKIDSLTLDGKPTTIKGRFLTNSELHFTNTKPYVIYGYAAVPANKTLTIDAGTEIHFHANSGLIVDKDASVKANGTLNDKIVFQGDRLEYDFREIPGQWGVIWLRAGSKNNILNHTQIKNSKIGILADSISSGNTPTLTLKNTEIYNSSFYGILGRETNIYGENVVIGNSGQASLACTIGGTYHFIHSTFANYWNQSLRQLPAVIINNHFTYKNDDNQEITETRDLKEANFINCIFDGNNSIEFLLDKVDGSQFNYQITNCMVKFTDSNNNYVNNAEMKFDDATHYTNIIINGFPHFKDTQYNDFIIGQNSDAINKAAPSFISFDILGVSRNGNPDIGAYQHITFE